MQTWSLSTHCSSCYFRAYLRQIVRPSNCRAAHVASVSRQRALDEHLRHMRPKQSSSQTSPASRYKNDTRPSRRARKEAALSALSHLPDSDRNRTPEQFNVQDRITKRLGVQQRLLNTEIQYIDPSLRYLKLADPDGTRWDSFQDAVHVLLESKPRNRILDFANNSLVGRLTVAAQSQEWQSDLDREIHYGFLDHIISHGKATQAEEQFKIDLRYPTEWYTQARMCQRNIHLHVGPTNSGKTYNALKRLEKAQSGFYAGPLRLLAHEVYSRFNNRGIACSLITGDDVRLTSDPGKKVQLYASTVEMVNVEQRYDVGVIDEIQMMGSEDRGWAWTRALLGASASELHLCGETRVVPLIRELVASMGDTLHIHQYERLNPLKAMSRSLRGSLANLRKGDCVVSFSVVNIHALKRQIELETGKRAAIVYGSLPPETRAQQAALFNDPDNDYDYLVASDAVGMGLNLAIKRVVFERTSKFNGSYDERLSISQIKQIAGRAGRFRTSRDDKSESSGKPATSIGLVTCLDEADLPVIHHALNNDAAPMRMAGILPTGEEYEAIAAKLPSGTPFEYISRRVFDACSTNTRFKLCNTKDNLSIARVLDAVPTLQLRDRLIFCASPAIVRGRGRGRQDHILVAMARTVADARPVTVADLEEIPLEVLDMPPSANRDYLESLEILHKSLILYLWLSYRFQQFFTDQDMAMHAKTLTEEKINDALVAYSANPMLRKRLLEMRKTSAMMSDQLKGSALHTPAMTMNPDATVEEVERRAREEEEREAAEQEAKPGLGDGDENGVVASDTVASLSSEPFSTAATVDGAKAEREWAGGSTELNIAPAELDVMDEQAAQAGEGEVESCSRPAAAAAGG